MSTSVRPRPPMPTPVYEPSTDFPTLEDEVPCPRARRWLLALVWAGVGLVLGLAVGLLIGRALGG